MKKFLSILLLAFALQANAQTNPITAINISLPANPDANVANWGTGTSLLTITASSQPVNGKVNGLVVESKILVIIKKNGAKICGSYTSSSAPVAGFNTATKVWSGGNAASLIGQDCVLKPGDYELSVQFFGNRGAAVMPLSDERTKPFTIRGNDQQTYQQPQNIVPANGTAFAENDIKKPITFRWTPIVPRPQEPTTYRLSVWQLMQGQNTAQARTVNQPIFTKDVDNLTQAVATNLITGPCKPPYLCSFIWNVQALNRDGKPIGGNNGTSELFSFKYDTGTTSTDDTKTSTSLVSPANGSIIDAGNLPVFKWETDGKPTSAYKIKIVELTGDQSPEVALRTNKPHFEKDSLDDLSFKYPPNGPQLIDGKKYGWAIWANGIWSKPWIFIIKPRPSLCKGLNVKFAQNNRDGKGDACCYDVSINNSYPGTGANAVYMLRIRSGAPIISATNAAGFTRLPAAIPPATNTITWIKTGGPIPNGSIALGNICFRNRGNAPFYVVYEWLNKEKRVICKDSVKLVCREEPPASACCQLGLRLFNSVANTFKKIRVTPVVTNDVTGIYMDPDSDGDNWTLTNGGAYYDYTYINGFIPANATDLIENDFYVQVNPLAANPKLKVEWIDGNGAVKKTEEIKLVCKSDAQLEQDDFEYAWKDNTQLISGSYTDEQVFAGAEAELCDESEIMTERDGECASITSAISCSGSQLSITLSTTAVPGATAYNWMVDGTAISGGTSFSAPLTGIGQTTANILLEVHGVSPSGGDTVLCTQALSVPYCKPTAEFVTSTPKVVCDNAGGLQGWKVTLSPATTCTNITSFAWDFGDGATSNTGTFGEIEHQYANAGDYTAKLNITDANGCTSTYSYTIKISSECDPKFHANYEWCDRDINKTQKYPITVTFTNQSVAFCASTYVWDFGDGSPVLSSTDATVSHTYQSLPGQEFTVKLTMKDPKACPNGKTVAHTFAIKPVHANLSVVACPDGIVKFSTTSNKTKWHLPNWQALVNDPTYYCLPIPFAPLPNIALNALLGLGGTSVPQSFVNLFNIKHFELKFKDNTNVKVSITCVEDQEFATATCTITESVTVHITTCEDFTYHDKVYQSNNGKSYMMKRKFKVHYREKHGDPALGVCFDLYVHLIPGVTEKTHLMARTVLKVNKRINGTPWSYYRRTKADAIEADVVGTFRKSGGPDGCNGIDPVTWNHGKSTSNSSHIKYKANTPSLYKIDRSDLLQSRHYIQKGSFIWETFISKTPGNCQP